MAGGEGVVTGGGVSAGATTPDRLGWLGPRIKTAATRTITTIRSRPIIPFFVMGPSSAWLADVPVLICNYVRTDFEARGFPNESSARWFGRPSGADSTDGTKRMGLNGSQPSIVAREATILADRRGPGANMRNFAIYSGSSALIR